MLFLIVLVEEYGTTPLAWCVIIDKTLFQIDSCDMRYTNHAILTDVINID